MDPDHYRYQVDLEMENCPYSGVINSIVGGPAGGDSRNARERTAQNLRNNDKSYAAPTIRGTNAISFEDSEIPPPTSREEDLDNPDVPLVVSLTIATYRVNKVLVDMGSSSNIISKRTLDQMNLGRVEYGRFNSSLSGFGGATVRPLGSVRPQVSLGTFPARITDTVRFVVVDRAFDYNMIFGHPGLNLFEPFPPRFTIG